MAPEPDANENERREERHRRDSETEARIDRFDDPMLGEKGTAVDTEAKFENFVLLVIKEGLKKFERHKKEGHLKGDKKSPKDTTLVEIGGAILVGAAGAPFGSIGTGAAAGATVSKFIYEFGYGYSHRKKAKAIAKNIEANSIDEKQILDMLAAIGAEIFRVFEHQLSNRELNDLKKVVHDLVVSLYDAICDNPAILDEDEPERSVTLARSATDQKTVLDQICGGHPLGIYDHGEYYVSKNTGNLNYKFRLLFENEDINEEVWRVANDDQIGSYQPEYVVTKDMIMQVKERAISRVISFSLERSAKQSSKDMRNALNAAKNTEVAAEVLFEKIAEVEAKRQTWNMKLENLEEPRKIVDAGMADINTMTAEVREKSVAEMQGLVVVHSLVEEEYVKSNDIGRQIEMFKEETSRLASSVTPPIKPGESNIARPKVTYMQREEPYKQIKHFLELQPETCTESSRLAVCIVSKLPTGKSEMARSYAYTEFLNKNMFWIDATNEQSIKESIQEVAGLLKIEGLDCADPTAIWEQICTTVAPEDTLIVFDNAGTPEDITHYFPWHFIQEALSPKVIVTSRNEQDWRTSKVASFCKVIELPRFSEKECLTFFKERLKEKGYFVERPPDAGKDVEVLGDTNEVIIELGRRFDFIPKFLEESLHAFLDAWSKSRKRDKRQNRVTLTKYLKNLTLDKPSQE